MPSNHQLEAPAYTKPMFTIPIKKLVRGEFLIKLVRIVLQLTYFCSNLYFSYVKDSILSNIFDSNKGNNIRYGCKKFFTF
ncbi:hypothetical protein E7L53_12005 [Priestia megaterium]|nr:hypothetical protein [Priestia megaterium]QCY26431.1 hypothetical protein EQG57_18285 [Priestia megaterium NBRC 15308 = ATCC 14581]THJ41878.1 hypothetical protein E7L53_12005 [Priestia megaterium]